jgi:excisionase family DNA binding protein
VINVTLIPASEVNNGTKIHCSVREAAKILGVSDSTIRRAARKAGVKRISGSSVRGGILIDRHPFALVIAYSA